MSYEIGEYLGRGDNAVVYKVTKNGKSYAMKFIKENTPDIIHEISIHKEAARLGCAPNIYEDFLNVEHEGVVYARAIVMDVIQTFRSSISDDIQKDIVQRTWLLIQHGIIHNDLHQGNIGMRREGRRMRGVIFDFGEAERIDPPKDCVVLRQLLVSQLYALITKTDCNTNNSIPLCGDHPIHDTIYLIRKHSPETLQELQALVGIRCQQRRSTRKRQRL